jgi:hypothetical protein
VIRAGISFSNVRWPTLMGAGRVFLPFLGAINRCDGTVFRAAERLDRIEYIVAGG